jgi:hypothetical protein
MNNADAATSFRQNASGIVRSDIESAARAGYLDAVSGRGMSPEYEVQSYKWQRNYEIGRIWVAAARAMNIVPQDWPENQARPAGFDGFLRDVQRMLGGRLDDLVPRESSHQPVDPELRMRVSMHTGRRGLRRGFRA